MGDLNVIVEPLRAFLVRVGGALPGLGVALVVVIAGWLVAKAARFAAGRALRAVNFHVLTERAGVDAFLRQGGTGRDTSALVSALVYWLVILAALTVAFNGLGLTHVAELLTRVLMFVPKLLVGLLVIVVGSYFGLFVGNAVLTYCRDAGIADGEMLARVARYAIVVFVFLIAIDTLELGGVLVQQTFLILLAGLVFALALAFGLGGRDWAAALLARWFPRREREDR
jgi:hypothetical protein